MLTKILLIDDDIFFRELVKDILVDYPVDILEASNGDKGLEIIKNNPIKLVITDIIMPEKEGLESIIEITTKYPGIKILAISGGGSSGNVNYLEMAESLGAHGILAKPFGKDELISELKKLLPEL